jgi:hypothetical protein
MNDNMIDDILISILKFLEIKEVLRLESVSKQFERCVSHSLKSETGLRIGFIRKQFLCDRRHHSVIRQNISELFIRCDGKYCDLIENKDKLSLVLQKFPNIQSLYLNYCSINSETIETIATYCHRLECLSLGPNIFANEANDLLKAMAKVFADKLKHLSINNYFLQTNSSELQMLEIDAIVPQLKSLCKLSVTKSASSPPNVGNFEILLNGLPQTICSLSLHGFVFDIELMNALINGNGKHVNELYLDILLGNYPDDHIIGDSHENALHLICDEMDLKKLTIKCSSLPSLFVRKLTQLKRLEDLSLIHRSDAILDLSGIGVYLPTNVRSLRLDSCSFEPKMLKNIKKQFPVLEKLVLNYINFICECDDQNNDSCHDCYLQCVISLTSLPKLKSLVIEEFGFIRPVLIDLLMECPNLQNIGFPNIPISGYCDQQLIDHILRTSTELAKRDSKQLFTLAMSEFLCLSNEIKSSLPTNLRIKSKVFLCNY